MSDFLKTMLLINGYVACALAMLCLLVAQPARADSGGVVGAISGAIVQGMANNNAGDPGYSGGDDD